MRKLTRREFEKMVKDGIKAIPEKFLRMLNNVAIVIEDEPASEQRKKMELRDDETLFGLYEGVPLGERGSDYTGVLPDKITIFKNPTEEEALRACSGGHPASSVSLSERSSARCAVNLGDKNSRRMEYEAEIKKIVRDTVWHEIAHHFGMDEDRVEKAEMKRAKQRKEKNKIKPLI